MPLFSGYGAPVGGGLRPLSSLFGMGGGMGGAPTMGMNTGALPQLPGGSTDPWGRVPFDPQYGRAGTMPGPGEWNHIGVPGDPRNRAYLWQHPELWTQPWMGPRPDGGTGPLPAAERQAQLGGGTGGGIGGGIAAPYSPETEAYKAFIRDGTPLPAGWTDNSATGGGIVAPSYRGEDPPPGWTPPRFQTLGGSMMGGPQTLQSLYSLVYPGQRRF